MSEIKQGVFDAAMKLLNGVYALPVIVVAIVYLWSNLSQEQITRIELLKPFMNSSWGIAFAVILVASYFFHMIALAKNEIRETFTNPLNSMVQAVLELKTVLNNALQEMERRIEIAEGQHLEIKAHVEQLKNMFDAPK